MKSILERLSMEAPAGRLNRPSRMRAIRSWVKSHESEISEALERGYTWQQISGKCVEMWHQSGQFVGAYLRKKETLIADCYYEVKTR